MKITEKLRAKILLSLPKGYAKKVAETCHVSEVTVYNVLHHQQENLDVALAIIKLATATKEEREKQHKSFYDLAKQL